MISAYTMYENGCFLRILSKKKESFLRILSIRQDTSCPGILHRIGKIGKNMCWGPIFYKTIPPGQKNLILMTKKISCQCTYSLRGKTLPENPY